MCCYVCELCAWIKRILVVFGVILINSSIVHVCPLLDTVMILHINLDS